MHENAEPGYHQHAPIATTGRSHLHASQQQENQAFATDEDAPEQKSGGGRKVCWWRAVGRGMALVSVAVLCHQALLAVPAAQAAQAVSPLASASAVASGGANPVAGGATMATVCGTTVALNLRLLSSGCLGAAT
jgi:hypothetical protein